MNFELWDLALLFLCARIGGTVATRLHQPALIGELLAGAALGAIVSGLAASTIIQVVAQIGIMFLLLLTMLSIDLEAIEESIERLVLSQICTAAIIFALLMVLFSYLQMNLDLVLVVGAAIFGSSTVISVRMLLSIGELNSREGQAIVGLQVMNAIIEILLISSAISLLQAKEFTVAPVLSLVLMAVGTFAVVSRIGDRFIHGVMRSIQVLKMDEVLLALTLLLAFSVAAITEVVGLTPYLGVMLIGVLISRTPQAEAVSSSIKQIGEGFFIPVFFASLGLGVTFLPILNNLQWLITLLVSFIAIRFIAVIVPALFSGNSVLESLRIAAGMAPMSEYGLLMLRLGVSYEVLSATDYSTLVV
ncbi:MAG TPA: cation:proton antiporter, partial [Methanomicrobiales archaeon]|nr:cation:proton antiporter [Methanomicrobiales archaeon]